MDDSHVDWKIIKHPLYQPRSPPWLDLRVFYIRLSGLNVSQPVPEVLTLGQIPLTPNTIIEVNGRRSSIYSDTVSTSLRRDRVDLDAKEATFVSTDSVRLTGNAMFEVYNEGNLFLSMTLELSNGENGRMGNWKMRCQAVGGGGFLKRGGEKCDTGAEVYVTGYFSGSPIILTKTVRLGLQKVERKKLTLDAIPEYDEPRLGTKSFWDDVAEEEYEGLYRERDYIEGEGGELSWFNAGVRVGVGISLGICLGVGLGIGLLSRTYSSASKSFKRRFI